MTGRGGQSRRSGSPGGPRKGSGSGKGASAGKAAGKGQRKPPPTRRSPTPARVPARGERGTGGKVSGGADRRAGGLGGDQVEGRQAVRELLLAGRRRVREVIISTDRADAPVLDDILTLAGQLKVSVREVSRGRLDTLARTDGHQGVIAHAAPLRETDIEELFARSEPPPFLLAADGVTDPGNLGALLRTAECAGVSGVVLPRHRSAHVSPTVTKAAAGAVEHLRFALVGGLPAAMTSARQAGVTVVGLDMGGDVSIHGLPVLTGPVMVVVGAEGRGLGRLVRERCDLIASIPLLGQTESLNVSVAGALALYEVVRQRG